MNSVRKTMCIIAVLLLGVMGASGAVRAETAKVASWDPFNFVDALVGQGDRPAIELSVDIRFPEDTTGRVPAVLFVHGSGGPLAQHTNWLELFLEMGFAAVAADHFQPRGKASAVGSHIRLTGAAMAVDALKILAFLADHPRIDPDKIAIMGASKGGGVAWYTLWEPLQRAIVPGRVFAAHIALYPTCVHWDHPETTGQPLLVLLGGADDWTGVDECVESVRGFNRAGLTNITSKVYPDAPHGFDGLSPLRAINHAYSVTNCRFSIGRDGRDYANGVYMETPLLKGQALKGCISKGVHYGQHAKAADQSRRDVRAFLTSQFQN